MTKDQIDIEDVNFILSEVRRIASMSPAEEKKHIEQNPNASDFLYSLRDEKTKGEYICGRQASRRLVKLAERHLDRQRELRDNIDPVRLSRRLASLLVIRFLKEAREVNKSEVQSLLSGALKQVKAEQKSLIHYIPCVVFDVFGEEQLTAKEESKYKQFWIGPVLFCRTSDFLRQHKKAIKEDLSTVCNGDAEHIKFMMNSLVKFFKGYRWVAVVSIPQCNEKISRLRAETAVQGALDILKLAFGPGQTASIRLAESLTTPADIAQVRRSSPGPFTLMTSRRWADGISISEGAFDQITNSKPFSLEAAGSALNACIDPRKEIHLSRRFLDALTWYGQAVTESMPSAKIVKYVAAWERLTITQKEEIGLTEKVTRRMAILSHLKKKGDLSNTLKEVKTIYDWRSKLMHGSSSPFDKQLLGVSSLAGQLTTTALNRSLEIFVPLAHRDKNAKESDLEAEYVRLESALLPARDQH
ncbi:MAG TPA: hypothetical protein VJ784_19085 [Pyrinomonadaceae bacterium]|nr:hypothetical protein [Pyrinomonadaceae bacterium]